MLRRKLHFLLMALSGGILGTVTRMIPSTLQLVMGEGGIKGEVDTLLFLRSLLEMAVSQKFEGSQV